MKGKFGTFILFIIMLALLGGLIFFVYAIYTDYLNADVVQTIHTSENDVSVEKGKVQEKKKVEENKSIVETISNIFFSEKEQERTYSDYYSAGKFFYEQLSDTQKIIYNGLQQNKDNLITGNYKIEFGTQFQNILERKKW